MQSKPSQMEADTKAADRPSRATDTGNSMAQAPTQEPIPSDARVSSSVNAQPRIYPSTNSHRPHSTGRGRGARPHPFQPPFDRLNRRREEHIAHETSGEARDANAHDGGSPQQTNRNVRSRFDGRGGHSGHHHRQRQAHDEQRDANVRDGIDNRVTDGRRREGERMGEGVEVEVREEGGEQEGEGEAKELPEGNHEASTSQGLHPLNPIRLFPHKRSARDKINHLEGIVRRQDNDVDVLSTRNEELSDEIKTIKEELARLQLDRDLTNELLHERTAELSSAQLFLGKADSTSVTDVSRMVDILNAEISQASISIADSLSYRQVASTGSDTDELNRLIHSCRSSIGPRLCDILALRLCQPSAEFDPMITQLALQAGLSNACCRIINDWNPPFWDTSSSVDHIYTNMRLSEGQVIAGRWRALAYTYINDQGSELGNQGQDAKDKIQEANANYLRSILRDLLAIVGWSSRDPNHNLPSDYNGKMRILSDKALKLHETIGRGITSKDLIVEIIPGETPFDPTKMDDADRQRGKPDDAILNDTVACTVELGLKYKSVKAGGGLEDSGVILKPKVLLASVLIGEGKDVTPAKTQD